MTNEREKLRQDLKRMIRRRNAENDALNKLIRALNNAPHSQVNNQPSHDKPNRIKP
jgi:hypothetical protein